MSQVIHPRRSNASRYVGWGIAALALTFGIAKTADYVNSTEFGALIRENVKSEMQHVRMAASSVFPTH